MSGLAQVLLSRGYIITGSDLSPNNLTTLIESKGGLVYKGHKDTNITGAQIVVYSSSISGDNPELKAARKNHIKVLHRAQLLAELMKEKDGIAVTGAHGKTTTSTMISDILIKAHQDPTCILGGESAALNGNARNGKGKYLVAEADESDGSQLYLNPKYGIITNIDYEHLDHYKTMDNNIKANLEFLKNIKPDGAFFGLIDNEFIKKILLNYNGRFATFGLTSRADLYPASIKSKGLSTEFDCIYKGSPIGRITLEVPGMHNVLNALASILFAIDIGIEFNDIKSALSEFRSARRRFEIYPDTGRVTVVEDYAHHPTEITATLEACRLLKPKRVIAVFQPHRYTRTKELKKQFGSSFRLSDRLILTNIYPAFEKPLKGVSIRSIFDEAVKDGFKDIHILPKEDITDYLYDTCQDGDLVAVLGAGDIGDVAKEFSIRLKGDLR